MTSEQETPLLFYCCFFQPVDKAVPHSKGHLFALFALNIRLT